MIPGWGWGSNLQPTQSNLLLFFLLPQGGAVPSCGVEGELGLKQGSLPEAVPHKTWLLRTAHGPLLQGQAPPFTALPPTPSGLAQSHQGAHDRSPWLQVDEGMVG